MLPNIDISKFQFQDIPQEYHSLMNQVKNTTLKQIYNNIDFLYVDYSSIASVGSIQELTYISNYLFSYLSQFLFFTYYLPPFVDHNILNANEPNDQNLPANINVVICVENKCLIIKSLGKNMFFNLIQTLQIPKINCNKISNEPIQIKEEINNLSKHFLQKDYKNGFIQFTIRPISCYLIRRFYYPTNFFKDPSFFIYSREKNSSEQIFKSKLNEYINGKNLNEIEYNDFISSIEKIIQNDEVNTDEKFTYFDNIDFVELRTIDMKYSLVFHSKSLHLFILKKLNYYLGDKHINREINFCLKNTNRCFVQCYGFIKEKGRVESIIYQFMSNGTLNERANQMNEYYLTQTFIRFFEGINYLHSNKKVHRDIKPSNILFDNDFNAYVSDFETIREIGDDKDDFTYDFGSNEFASPEQIHGNHISYSTDIYSFGKTIEYILGKNQNYYYFKDTIQFLSNLAFMCIKNEPNERASLNQIKDHLASFFDFFYNHDFNFFNVLFNNFRQIEHFQFFYENLAFSLKYQNNEKIKNIFNNYLSICKNNKKMEIEIYSETYYNLGIECLRSNNLTKAKEYFELAAEKNSSNILCKIGNLYFTGQGFEKDFLKAKEYFERAVSNDNDSQALNLIGVLYYYGNGVKQDYCEAKKYFERAIKQNNNNSFALYNLGNLYYQGLGIEKDFIKAKELFELSAKQNNSEAFNCLGNIYYFGKGVKQDYEKAEHYYELAAKQNNSSALINLSIFYLNGLGVEKNIMKAKHYYELAAQQNDSKAIVCLGHLYLTIQDYNKAKEYFELAVKYANSDGLNGLGNLYLNGNGVEKDYQKAKEYFEKAIEMNNYEAYNRLGYLYLLGKGVNKDYTKAKEYFEIAVEHDISDGLVNLGIVYLNGQGVKKDLNKAKELFEKAASLNDSYAFNWLGHIYYNGSGVEKNYIKAREYFESAVKLNNFDALANLGLIYLEGHGVSKDVNKAKKYFEIGASHNNDESLNCLGNLYLHGEGVEQDFKKAKEYYELAIKFDNSNSLTNLGHLYYNGQGVEKDYNKARKYLEKAASLNNPEALLTLGDFYLLGIGVEKNGSKAIQFYKDAILLNNYSGYNKLGKVYYFNYHEEGRDILRAKDYFELAIKHNDSESYFYLFIIYAAGEGGIKEDPEKAEKYIEQYLSLSNDPNKPLSLCMIGLYYLEGSTFKKDYNKAKSFLELSSQRNFSYASFQLGLIYWNGIGLEKNYSKAKDYFELAVNQGNFDSYFYLGYFYENGKGVQKDLNKAINYYLKCAEIQSGGSLPDNRNYYRSHNDLGLIYLLEQNHKNLQLAEKYIKFAGINEYQFGQNNLALFLQNYSESKNDFEYFLMKAAKKKFALSEFNLAHHYEKEQKIDKSIEFFELTSKDENEKFIFQENVFDDDERLEISKTFVACYSNLKLTKYYFDKGKVETARNFFLKAIFKPLFKFLFQLKNESYSFVFKFDDCKLINLKNFFLNFPLFNLKNQIKDINDVIFQSNDWSEDETKTNNSIELLIEKDSKFSKNDEKDLNLNDDVENMFNNLNNSKIYDLLDNESKNTKFKEFRIKYSQDSTERSMKYPMKLYKLVFENLNDIQSDIDDILNLLKSFLDTPPFYILFGRIKLKPEKVKPNKSEKVDINKIFYDGFND